MHSLFSWLKGHFIPHDGNAYRPASLSRDFLVAAVALVCVVEGFLATSLMLESRSPNLSAAILESALISLTNTKRAQAHEPALVQSAALGLAAQAKADDMARRGYFAHKDPEGKQAWDWMREAGYDYAYAGENLAAHFYDSSDVVDAWMRSPSHRANITAGKYTEMGIGVAHGTYQGAETIFVVQLFGTTKAAYAQAHPQKVEPEVAAAVSTSPASEPIAQADVVRAPAPVVEGQSISNIPSQLSRLLSSPRTVALFVLGTLLAIIAGAVMLAFFIRLRVQPVDLLINGMVVAAFVLSVIAANSYFFSGVHLPGSEAAAISAVE